MNETVKLYWERLLFIAFRDKLPVTLCEFLRDLPLTLESKDVYTVALESRLKDYERLLHDAANDVAAFWATERQRGREEMMLKVVKEAGNFNTLKQWLEELPELKVVPTIQDARKRIEQLENLVQTKNQMIADLQGLIAREQTRYDDLRDRIQGAVT